ncbi:MAG: hypothetical protein FWE33_03350, partial [Defluviitaleaceae bacterium]|nr:hypothetical protein [Defluviitaleaceae bacterium]
MRFGGDETVKQAQTLNKFAKIPFPAGENSIPCRRKFHSLQEKIPFPAGENSIPCRRKFHS